MKYQFTILYFIALNTMHYSTASQNNNAPYQTWQDAQENDDHDNLAHRTSLTIAIVSQATGTSQEQPFLALNQTANTNINIVSQSSYASDSQATYVGEELTEEEMSLVYHQ